MLRKADFSASTERLLLTRTYPGSIQSRVTVTPANARLNLAYSYQNNGNISQMVDHTRSETLTYGYDDLDRLLSVSGPYSKSYTYNQIGNILTGSGTTYTYGDTNHKHAVTGLNTGESYTYDANGNMITRVENGQTYTQTFDIENRLSSVTVGEQTTQFIYDGDGNLVKKIKPDGSKTLYIAGLYEVDKTSGGSVTRTVTYYPVAGAMRINSTLYYLLKDHLGSASVVTDGSGTIVGEDRFYPYGETRFTTGSMNTDKLYTGQREMTGLGIYHYGARFFSPKLGRFLSPDTLIPSYAIPQYLNRYSYVLGNPLKYTDPTGHVVHCDENDGDVCDHDDSGNSSSNGNTGNNDDLNDPIDNREPDLPASWSTGVYCVESGCYFDGSTDVSWTLEDWPTFVAAGVAACLLTGLCVPAATAVVNTGTNTVYRVVQDGRIIYIGITQNFAQRAAYWANARGWNPEPIRGLSENLSRYDARAVEQILIEHYGLENLANQINSISATNPIYQAAIQRGNEILQTIGFFGK